MNGLRPKRSTIIMDKILATRRMRIWPAIVAPLGLTMLLGVAIWLFFSKVHADQERAETAALRLEGYARLEARELTAKASELSRSFSDERTRKRFDQEKNMRVELRGVMDAVYRVLTAGLEKTRSSAPSGRDVGDFPSGFESLRLFLELSDRASSTDDAPVEALRACATELSALLPPGCSLTVVENNFEELLALGGGNDRENVRTETIAREFIWDDGTQNRHWTLQIRLSEPDEYPVLDVRELAEYLDARIGETGLSGATWRGWLVSSSGEAVAAFPVAISSGTPGREKNEPQPPFIDMPGEWVEVDGRRLVWLEKGNTLESPGVTPAVSVAIDSPAPPLVWREELLKDRRWGLTLGLLGLLSLGMWSWFGRALWLSRRRGIESLVTGERLQPSPDGRRRVSVGKDREKALAVAAAAIAGASAGQPVGRNGASADAAQRRLVRDESVMRPSDVQGVIVADIGDDGEVEVGAEIIRETPKRQVVIPSGSLVRLQERHRGGRGRAGSRVLDQAKSPLVRELAKRIRPVVPPQAMSTQAQSQPQSQAQRVQPQSRAQQPRPQSSVSVSPQPQSAAAAQAYGSQGLQKTVGSSRRTGRATEKIVRKQQVK